MAKAKASSFSKFGKWHQSREGLLIIAIVELFLSYLVASRAIDTGSLIEYFLTILLFIGGVQNLVRLSANVIHGKR